MIKRLLKMIKSVQRLAADDTYMYAVVMLTSLSRFTIKRLLKMKKRWRWIAFDVTYHVNILDKNINLTTLSYGHIHFKFIILLIFYLVMVALKNHHFCVIK